MGTITDNEAPALATQRGTRDRLEAIGRACAMWLDGSPAFRAAVDDTAERTGIPTHEVARQLARVCEPWQDPGAVTAALDMQIGDWRMLDRTVGGLRAVVPSEVLHLVAGTVPGLAIESCLWGLAIDSHNQCRLSRDDGATSHFHKLLTAADPYMAGHVELVEQPRWHTAQAAVVYGSDETVAMVRMRIGHSRPVADFGSREGIALLTSAACEDRCLVAALASDTARFRHRGCMSPHTVLVLGDETDARHAHAALGSEMGELLPELPVRQVSFEDHVFERAVSARHSHDIEAMTGRWTSGGSPTDGAAAMPELHAPAAVSVLQVAGIQQLRTVLAAHGSTLQTCVLACTESERPALAQVLHGAGVTRTCRAGTAHEPPFAWPHDGRGHARQLVRICSTSHDGQPQYGS